MGLLQKRMANVFAEFNKKEVEFLLKPFYEIVEEMKKDVGDTKWLDELKEYVLKHSPKLKALDIPIFSARHFTKKIDEHKEKLEKWLGEQP